MYVGSLQPASNQADYELTVEAVDDDTGEDIDLAGASIVFELRDRDSGQTRLSATTGNGKVSILDTGVFRASFARPDMQGLRANLYDVGCILTVNGATRQFIIGTLPVLDGVVSP
jgi:hypothetical protein